MLWPCPSCGYLIFTEKPGSDEICKICFWQDDISQLRFPKVTGANKISLIEAQSNFLNYGASENEFHKYVHPVSSKDIRDFKWRPIDLKKDNFEEILLDNDYGSSYPQDLTQLYYWRSTFWRKQNN